MLLIKPMTEPLYIIPDIHGQFTMLEEALALIEAEGGVNAPIVFLGDYVDRGPDSRAVIDLLIDGQAKGRNWITLRGNHDQMFLDFLDYGAIHPVRLRPDLSWIHPRLGGDTTLASYGIIGDEDNTNHTAAVAAVPRAHRDWLASLPFYHLTGPLLFVHAGIAPGVPLSHQSPEDMLWIRENFLIDPKPHPWLIIHGHTALDMPTHFGNRIDLDGGAGRGRSLWPAVIEDRSCWLLTKDGRQLLTPAEQPGNRRATPGLLPP